jgi:transcriptional regulator with XRE-family HTH domain
MTTANILRAAREKVGLSQGDVAKKLGISSAAVRHYEIGLSKPPAERAKLLAKILKIDLAAIAISDRIMRGSKQQSNTAPVDEQAPVPITRGARRQKLAPLPANEVAPARAVRIARKQKLIPAPDRIMRGGREQKLTPLPADDLAAVPVMQGTRQQQVAPVATGVILRKGEQEVIEALRRLSLAQRRPAIEMLLGYASRMAQNP